MAKKKSNLSKTSVFALFTSFGTLLCCALPILFVTFGLGATIAAININLPFLVILAKHKIWIFALSGTMLLIAGYLTYREGRTCPIDAELAETCLWAQKWNKRILILTSIIWAIGFFAAYLLLPIAKFFGW